MNGGSKAILPGLPYYIIDKYIYANYKNIMHRQYSSRAPLLRSRPAIDPALTEVN